jgi:O-antigen/teichoic acid export membrane protein
MRQPSRRLAARANFIGNVATILISAGQAVLLMPLCVEQLGTRVYGAWLGATELLAWIQLLDFGIPNLMAQRIGAAIGKGDHAECGRWFATGLAMIGVIAGVLLCAGLFLGPVVTQWADVPHAESSRFTVCFRVGVAANVVLLLFNTFVSLAWGFQRTGFVNLASVLGASVGLMVSVTLLVGGWGLWALAAGLAVRAAIVMLAGLVFAAGLLRRRELTLTLDHPVFDEVLSLLPPMTAANVGYLLAHHSEIVLVTTVFGPAIALIYAVTRRVADGLRSLLDSIAWAVYGGFAHLASDDRQRAREVLTEILSLRFAAACLCAAVYVAVNEGFVTLLFGPENFGGVSLTVAFAVQMIAGGQSFLINYLYRAAGRVREGSWWLAGEAAVRVSTVFLALRAGWLAAPPVAATLTASAVGVVIFGRLKAILPANQESGGETRRSVGALAVLAVGIAIAIRQPEPSWTAVVVTAALLIAAGGALLLGMQPAESRVRFLSAWIKT